MIPPSLSHWAGFRSRFIFDGLTVLIVLLCFASPICSQTIAFGEMHPHFGIVVLGQKSDPKIISVVNISNRPIFLSHITASGDFNEADECPLWLPEGDG
ncbi:MAG: hypothetical protein ACRD4I_12780, partial [Candidatus Angelobacter sp.]